MNHKIGVLGLHHDHVWGNLEELQRTGKAEIIGAADPYPELLDKFAENYPNAARHTDYDQLLNDPELTAVYLFASNKGCEDLTVAACEKGLHCLVEKPMASTRAGAQRMLDAARQNNVRLMINWPFVWWPQLRHAIDLAKSGDIGQLWQVRYRAAHQGPVELGCSKYFCDWLYDQEQNGAGALMDYCCYGAVLCEVLLGSPSSVQGMGLNTGLKPDLSLEDNAILLLRYPNALGVTEASWTQIGSITSYTTTIYGSKGTLHIEPNHDGKLWKCTPENEAGFVIDSPEQPDHLETASKHFLAAIEDPSLAIHLLCDAEYCNRSQATLQAGIDAI